MLEEIDGYISKYNLSKENQDGFIELRKDYNKSKNPIKFYTMVCYAFNYQIRFNKNNEYNMPFGKNRSSFNPSLRQKFISFVKKLHEQDCMFLNNTFKDFDFSDFDEYDFVYCDPPYQGTTKYSTSEFNYNEFWNWCRKMSKDNIVLISEYNAPDDFECIWSKETLANFDCNRDDNTEKKKRIEKLFKYRGDNIIE